MRSVRFLAITTLLASSICASASAETIIDWKFDDPAGTPLSSLAGSSFHRNADGVETDGNGQLVIRNTAESPKLYYAPLPETVTNQPIWMIVDIDSWITKGSKTDEGIRFGLSSDKKVESQIACIRLTRDSNTRAQLSVPAGGDAGDSHSVSRWFDLPFEQTVRFGLYYDHSENLYALFCKEGSDDWTQIGYGMTDPDRGAPKYLRMNLFGHFTDAPNEAMHVDSVTIQTDPPVPGLKPEFISPKVTADSWVVAEADTGKIIASRGLHEPRKIASISKVMNTYTVLKLEEKHPGILKERVYFSESAAAWTGSTCEIEAGESIPMSDLLYAFMLPSGNDAGVAIAEHLSARLAPPQKGERYSTKMETRKNYISEMNRNAKLLGMKDTVFRTPYGDGGFRTERTSTLGDLLILADAAMEIPLFKTIVSTADYSATVTLPDGSTRTGTWKNTNKFLGEPGFSGIKTGTTGMAGACLLISYAQDGVDYYIAVLGSDGSAQRYDDVRMLIEEYL